MGWTMRSGLAALGVCGMCCLLAASCGMRNIDFDLRGETGGWGGGGSGAGGDSIAAGGHGETCSGTCQPVPMLPFEPDDFVLR
jgi:hypothetical protein